MLDVYIILLFSTLVIIATGFLLFNMRLSDTGNQRMKGFYPMSVASLTWVALAAMNMITVPQYFAVTYVAKVALSVVVAYSSCWFILNFAESSFAHSRVAQSVLIALPALDILMLITTGLHRLYFLNLDPPLPYENPVPPAGPFFFVRIALLVICTLLAYGILFRYIVRNFHRYPLLFLTGIGAVIPLLLNIALVLNLFDINHDISPIGFFFTIVLFAYFSYAPKVRGSRESIFSKVLSKITKSPMLSSGITEDAAKMIAMEGCRALNTHRVGIWSTTEIATNLKSIAFYDAATDQHSVQDDFDLVGRLQYMNCLKSERLIIIEDVRKPNPLSDAVDEYGPNICAMLDAPIRIGGKLAGVVCIEQDKCEAFPERRIWTTEEQNFVSSLADLVAVAIESTERHILMRRTETLMSNLPGMVYQCLNDPPDFTFTFVSEGSFALMGYTPEELMGNSTVKFFDMVHPDDVETLVKQNEVTLSIGLPLETTFRIVMKDGTVKWIWERSRVVEFNPDGTPLVLEGFYTDITEQRRLEAAELANRAKSDFLAKMSHEIRTPISAVLGMTDLALRDFPRQSVVKFLENIKVAGHQLISIINDILDFSKVEAGVVQLVEEKYSIHSMINDIVTMIHVRIGEKPLDFIVDDDPNLPDETIGDMIRIKQVIINLLNNAVKFTDEGHIIFSISSEPCEDEGRFKLIVSVTDTGIGIRDEDINALFESFSQVDTRRNRNIEGTGLGLAIAKNLVELMGGEVFVESKYNKGSCFSFYIIQKAGNNKYVYRLPDDENRKVALYKFNDLKARMLENKIRKLGAECDIIHDCENISRYTHVFFDSNNLDDMLERPSPGTKLIAVSRGITGDKKVPPDIEFVYMPPTIMSLLSLLSSIKDKQSEVNINGGEQAVQLHNTRLLVVDDIDINLIIAEEMLIAYGSEVDTANSGAAAIEMIKKNHYDMVFMDHMMPGLDGLDTTKAIRALPDEKYKTLPIIALTANVVGDAREKLLKGGMNDFLSKPLDSAEIKRVLSEWLPREKWINSDKY